MTTLDARPIQPAVQTDNYLTFTRGIASWLFTLDHKRIGVMYLFAVLMLAGFFGFGYTALRCSERQHQTAVVAQVRRCRIQLLTPCSGIKGVGGRAGCCASKKKAAG